MFSDAERAAFAVLLDRARANDIISEDEVEDILPPNLFARFLALSIAHENAIIARYDDEVWAKWRNDPAPVKYYKDQLFLGKKSYMAAPAQLEKLMNDDSKEMTFNRHLGILVHQKRIVWGIYNELSDLHKLWTLPGTEEHGWPPELGDVAPMKAVLPDAELPTCYGLRRLFDELGLVL